VRRGLPTSDGIKDNTPIAATYTYAPFTAIDHHPTAIDHHPTAIDHHPTGSAIDYWDAVGHVKWSCLIELPDTGPPKLIRSVVEESLVGQKALLSLLSGADLN
jgi:hypothetical protein